MNRILKDNNASIKDKINSIADTRLNEDIRATPVIEMINVNKTFGSNVVIPDMNFKIEDIVDKPEVIAVLGPSGCGKSTILNLIAGLITPTTGTIKSLGKLIEGPGMDRGMVFQKYSSFPFLNVIDNIAYPLIKVKGINKKTAREKAKAWVDRMYLTGSEYKYPSQLSGGMQQRVAIARTLCMDTRILLMDEPFGALDRKIRWEMQDLMAEILFFKPIQEVTVLIVTHDIPEAVYLADRVWIINKGTISSEDHVDRPNAPAREIHANPVFNDMVNYFNEKIFNLDVKNRK